MKTVTVERELLERVTDAAEHGIGIGNADLIALRALLSAQPVGQTDNAEAMRNALARIELLEDLLTRARDEVAEAVKNNWSAGLSVALQADIDAYLAKQAR